MKLYVNIAEDLIKLVAMIFKEEKKESKTYSHLVLEKEKYQ